MGSHDHTEHDQHQGDDAAPGDEPSTGEAGPEARSQVVETDDPAIVSGPAPPPGRPDRTTVVETGPIRGPNAAAFNPSFVPAPGGSAAPPRDGSRDRRAEERGRPSPPPSLARSLMFPGLVALVCGVAGAWGYSYFFGPSRSADQKTSGENSDASKTSDPAKGPDSGKNPDPPRKEADSGKLSQAEAAWLAAVKELQQAKAAEKAARGSEEEAQAILDFFKRTLLSAGRPGEVSLPEAFRTGGQGKDVTLLKAVDAAESKVAQTFSDRPLGEATVREMLGTAYLNLGDAKRAVPQFERAFALREAMQGAGHDDLAECRNQLAVAYRLADRAEDAGRLFERDTQSPAHASALALRGSMLLSQGKAAEAELPLRKCLAIRQKSLPDDWITFDTMSMLGEALVDLKRFADAEPLLLSGRKGLKERQDKIPSQDKPRLATALDRLVKLYEAWGKNDEAKKWRGERDSAEPAKKS